MDNFESKMDPMAYVNSKTLSCYNMCELSKRLSQYFNITIDEPNFCFFF